MLCPGAMPKWWRADRTGALADRLMGVEPRDRRDVAIGFATLFLAMGGHAQMEAARDTLFLQSLPPTRLPWAYLGIAALTLAGGAFQRRFLARVSPRKALRVTLLAGALAGVAFGAAPALHVWEAALLGFYVWTGLLATTIAVQFWLTAASVMDYGQAKRGFVLLGAGGLLGAFFGSIATSAVLSVAPARSLPLVASTAFAAAFFVARYFSPERTRAPSVFSAPPRDDRAGRDDLYLHRIVALVLLGSVTVTLVDYLFKSTVARQIPHEELGRFFSRYYAAVNLAAFGVELFVTPLLLRAGVHRLVLLMPALLLLVSAGFAAAGTLVWVMILRGVDGSLRHSTNRVGLELLHLPLENAFRAKLRTFTEAAGQRTGQGLASLVVLGALAFGVESSSLVWVPVALAALWLMVALSVERAYFGRLRLEVGRRALTRDARDAPLDRASERALVQALGSGVDSEVTTALDTILAHDRNDLVPVSLLEGSSPAVLKKALCAEWDPERAGTTAAIRKLLEHADVEVRAAALGWLVHDGTERELLDRFAADPGVAVRVTALVGLTRIAAEPGPAAELAALLETGDPAAIRALARAAHLLPPELISGFGRRIARASDPEAPRLLADALSRDPVEAHLSTLIDLLAPREARRSARSALVALGLPALEALSHALESPDTPPSVRVHLPRTIARFSCIEAVKTLERAFSARPDQTLGFKILRGLGRLRAEHPELPVDGGALQQDALRMIRRAVDASCHRRVVNLSRRCLPGGDGPCAELLATALAEDIERALERVFRILHILEPTRSFRTLFSAVRNGDPDIRAKGRDMLEHLAPPALKRALLALVEEGPTSSRLTQPLGFELARVSVRALRLAPPSGSHDARFEHELLATLAECLKEEQRGESTLLRGLADRYATSLPHAQDVEDAV
jgi:ATP:ADP antiporter, AAA family